MEKEEIFEEIRVENFSKLVVELNLQIREMPKIPSRKISTKILENNRLLVGKGATGIKAIEGSCILWEESTYII